MSSKSIILSLNQLTHQFEVFSDDEIQLDSNKLVKVTDRRIKYDAEWILIFREHELCVHLELATFLLVNHFCLEKGESFDLVSALIHHTLIFKIIRWCLDSELIESSLKGYHAELRYLKEL